MTTINNLHNMKFKEELKTKVANIATLPGDLRLPSSIAFSFEGDNIRLMLSENAVTDNMQKDRSAFEGWALVIYGILSSAGINCTITIDIENDFDKIGENNLRHYNRFLYRIMKFAEQYRFVNLSERLGELSGRFYYDGDYHFFDNSQLCINRPTKIAEDKGTPESSAEINFNENPSELIKETERIFNMKMGSEIERQLPVGIYYGSKKYGNEVFTDRASAIDLWGLSEDCKTMCVYELKAKDNAAVGIISELFFYANLMLDVYGENKNFGICEYDGKDFRGYNKLLALQDNPIEGINAIFLVQKMHPLITDNVIALLNNGSRNIRYGIIKYDADKNFNIV